MNQFRPGRFEILPVVVKNLLIINVLFFLAQASFKATGMVSLENLLGLHHVKSPFFQPWQILTHLFLHGGIGHLFANMFGLWMFGSVLENLWGPKRFLTFYFLCGFGAALLQLVSLWFQHYDLLHQYVLLKANPTPEAISIFFQNFGLGAEPGAMNVLNSYQANPDNSMLANELVNFITSYTNMAISYPTIGASGAIFGIMAAFVYLFPNTDIYLYFLFPIKAKWIGLAYFGYEVFSALQNAPGDNIAHWAHLGGGLVGFLLVITWNKTNRKKFY